MDFVDPRRTPFVDLQSRGELPHFYKAGGHYFVTFRLAGAIVAVHDREQPHRSELSPLDLAAKYAPPITLGNCALREPAIASLVQSAILHFEGQRYCLVSWCVLPNHVHVIFAPLPPYTTSQVLQSWKGFTARRANELLGRQGAFWERESFDHLIRSIEDMERFVRYIEANPVNAKLCVTPQEWPHSSAGISFVPA